MSQDYNLSDYEIAEIIKSGATRLADTIDDYRRATEKAFSPVPIGPAGYDGIRGTAPIAERLHYTIRFLARSARGHTNPKRSQMGTCFDLNLGTLPDAIGIAFRAYKQYSPQIVSRVFRVSAKLSEDSAGGVLHPSTFAPWVNAWQRLLMLSDEKPPAFEDFANALVLASHPALTVKDTNGGDPDPEYLLTFFLSIVRGVFTLPGSEYVTPLDAAIFADALKERRQSNAQK